MVKFILTICKSILIVCIMATLDRFTIDRAKFMDALRQKGYGSAKELTQSLGIHRNTLSDYLAGAPVLPAALSKVLAALELSPKDIITSSLKKRRVAGVELAGLISQLNAIAPYAAVLLFGSRARGDFKKFSDFDLGVFSSNELSFPELSRLMNKVEEFNEQSQYTVQITNLNQADQPFLEGISQDLIFLGGDLSSWIKLLQRCGIELYG